MSSPRKARHFFRFVFDLFRPVEINSFVGMILFRSRDKIYCTRSFKDNHFIIMCWISGEQNGTEFIEL